MYSRGDLERITDLSKRMYAASKRIRILSHLAWPMQARETFLKNGSEQLPQIDYPLFDPDDTLTALADIESRLGDTPADQWLQRICRTLRHSALLKASAGTAAFLTHTTALYGRPSDALPNESASTLDLANQFNERIAELGQVDLGEPPEACLMADYVAEQMREAVGTMFGDQAPEVLVVEELSANMLAGPARIRVRRSACFTDQDVDQLIHHEAYTHVATSLNGQAQPHLSILGASHAGTTKTQEGLAVFAEFISGSIDLDRIKRLSDRVVAIQMALDGADFTEVYRYYQKRTATREQAYENARRVFRGGVMTGGAPFTKDMVYLDGLLRVHHFLKTIVPANRLDCLAILFCGKLDIEDLPVLYQLHREGLVTMPRFLPPWASDIRFLVCHLIYTSFLNTIDLGAVQSHYLELLDQLPRSSAPGKGP